MKKENFNVLIDMLDKRIVTIEETIKVLEEQYQEQKEFIGTLDKEDRFTEEQDETMFNKMQEMEEVLEMFYDCL